MSCLVSTAPLMRVVNALLAGIPAPGESHFGLVDAFTGAQVLNSRTAAEKQRLFQATD